MPYGGFDSTAEGGRSIGGFGYLDIRLGNNGSVSNASTNPTGEEASKTWRSYPNNYTYAGGLKGNAIDYRGGRGYYKSSMPGGDETVAYSVRLMGDEVDPGQLYNYKDGGGLVRCVATNPEPNTLTFDLSVVNTSSTIPDQQYIAGDPNAVLTSEVPIPTAQNNSPNLAFYAWDTMDAPTGGVYRIAPGSSIPTTWNSDMTLYESFRDTSITDWSVIKLGNGSYRFSITSDQLYNASEIRFYIWEYGRPPEASVVCTRSGTVCYYNFVNVSSGYYNFHVYFVKGDNRFVFYGNTLVYLN